jgi:hypothetical protein
MTTTNQAEDSERADHGWERISGAAQDFARRVARDAGKFAERIEEHASEFARDVSRDWQRAQRDYRRAARHASRRATAHDVRQVFEDVRTVLSDMLDGVDELIGQLFRAPTASGDSDWVRVVINREATCSSCARAIAPGEDGFVRRTASGTDFRCASCGTPPLAG